MNDTAYSRKLQDPRWQKKRLKILERDQWACQKCFGTDSALHVHHRLYIPGKEPWDYDDTLLVTLCEECHENETQNMKAALEFLTHACIEQRMLASDIATLASGIYNLSHEIARYPPEVVGSILEWALRDDLIASLIHDGYWEHLEGQAKSRKKQDAEDTVSKT